MLIGSCFILRIDLEFWYDLITCLHKIFSLCIVNMASFTYNTICDLNSKDNLTVMISFCGIYVYCLKSTFSSLSLSTYTKKKKKHKVAYYFFQFRMQNDPMICKVNEAKQWYISQLILFDIFNPNVQDSNILFHNGIDELSK